MWLLLLSAMLSIAAASSAVSAQQQSCFKGKTAHITGPTNIRKSPSTSSQVVGTSFAGDSLTVTQQIGDGNWCWLKVADGTRTVGWLAKTDRVSATVYNRFLDTGYTAPMPASTAPSDIDNCCFVDRQCTTEQEWTDGYWAHQNRQCDAPPASTAPSDIDNCCFVDRQCTTEQEWTDGYWAHQNRQCDAPPQISGANLSMPRIEGSEEFVHWVTETLNLMESKLPALYQYVVSVTSVIEEQDRCLGIAYVGTGRTSLGSCFKDGRSGWPPYVFATVLAHEACHHHGEDMVTGVFDHEPCDKAGLDANAAMKA